MLVFYSIRACVDCDESTMARFSEGKAYAEANGLAWKMVPLTTTEKLDEYRGHKLPKKTKLPVWVDTETGKVWKKSEKTSKRAKKSSIGE